jgi:hypothetical protein
MEHATTDLAGNSLDGITQAFEPHGDDFPDFVLGAGHIRGRLCLCHSAQQADQVPPPALQVFQHVFRCGSAIFLHLFWPENRMCTPGYFFIPAGNGKDRL